MRKALFLDRDGTVNVEKNYLYNPPISNSSRVFSNSAVERNH